MSSIVLSTLQSFLTKVFGLVGCVYSLCTHVVLIHLKFGCRGGSAWGEGG